MGDSKHYGQSGSATKHATRNLPPCFISGMLYGLLLRVRGHETPEYTAASSPLSCTGTAFWTLTLKDLQFLFTKKRNPMQVRTSSSIPDLIEDVLNHCKDMTRELEEFQALNKKETTKP